MKRIIATNKAIFNKAAVTAQETERQKDIAAERELTQRLAKEQLQQRQLQEALKVEQAHVKQQEAIIQQQKMQIENEKLALKVQQEKSASIEYECLNIIHTNEKIISDIEATLAQVALVGINE